MTKELIIVIMTSSGVASIITAILTPYIKWGIEKKKIKLENRKELISQIRSVFLREDFSGPIFIKSQGYNRIRPYLSKELDDKIRSPGSLGIELSKRGQVVTAGGDLLKQQIHQELNEIEKKWGLI